MDDVKTIYAANSYAFAIKKDDSLWAWGLNSDGQLGDGTTTRSYVPIKIMDSVVSVHTANTSGSHTTLVIKTDGSLWGWGQNGSGQLGNGTKTDQLTPIKIMDAVSSVSYDNGTTMIITTDRSLWACGNNTNYKIGDGTSTNRTTPIKIMDNVRSVAVCGSHTFAIKADNSLWAWGWNSSGELGDGTTINRKEPVYIMDAVRSISTSPNHAMALKTDGSLWTWGKNSNGQLGDGTMTNSSVPIRIMDSVVLVAASPALSSLNSPFSVVIKSDGSLWTWGSNHLGRLGDGTTTDQSIPMKS